MSAECGKAPPHSPASPAWAAPAPEAASLEPGAPLGVWLPPSARSRRFTLGPARCWAATGPVRGTVFLARSAGKHPEVCPGGWWGDGGGAGLCAHTRASGSAGARGAWARDGQVCAQPVGRGRVCEGEGGGRSASIADQWGCSRADQWPTASLLRTPFAMGPPSHLMSASHCEGASSVCGRGSSSDRQPWETPHRPVGAGGDPVLPLRARVSPSAQQSPSLGG